MSASYFCSVLLNFGVTFSCTERRGQCSAFESEYIDFVKVAIVKY